MASMRRPGAGCIVTGVPRPYDRLSYGIYGPDTSDSGQDEALAINERTA